jgi:hypothetical protein
MVGNMDKPPASGDSLTISMSRGGALFNHIGVSASVIPSHAVPVSSMFSVG